MPRISLMSAVLVLSLAGPAFSQEWTEFISKEDGFRVTAPSPPTMTTTTYMSQYGASLPARIYTVERGREKYTATVVDYSQVERLLTEKAKSCPPSSDERCTGTINVGLGYWKMDMAGALLNATLSFIRRDAKLTDLTWNFMDLVEVHLVQLTNNADQSRTFATIAMHDDKLYILEGTVPKGYPEPGLFQQSMGFVDKDGNGMRYRHLYSNIFPAPPRNRGGQQDPGAAGKHSAPGMP